MAQTKDTISSKKILPNFYPPAEEATKFEDEILDLYVEKYNEIALESGNLLKCNLCTKVDGRPMHPYQFIT